MDHTKQLIRVKYPVAKGVNPNTDMIARLMPGKDNIWRGCKFIFDDQEPFDWIFVYENIPNTTSNKYSTQNHIITPTCPDNSIFITVEPASIKKYGTRFLSQFGHIRSSQDHKYIRHHSHTRDQCGLAWFYGWKFNSTDPPLSWHEIYNQPAPNKTKTISTVCSNKSMKHTMHSQRLAFVDRLQKELPELNRFGWGYQTISDKAEALQDYAYHIAIENSRGPYHWTEKISDSFLAYSLPFYDGATNLEDYFPKQSFIRISIDQPNEAIKIIRNAISNNEYIKRLPYIKEARKLVLEEYNIFSLVADFICQQKKPSISNLAKPNRRIYTRHAFRVKYPIQGALDLLEKLTLR